MLLTAPSLKKIALKISRIAIKIRTIYYLHFYFVHCQTRREQVFLVKMPSHEDPAYSAIIEQVGLKKRNLISPGTQSARIQTYIDEVNKNGYAIIRDAFDNMEIEEAKSELEHLVKSGKGGPAGEKGRNPFEGIRTGRIYALLDKSRVFDKFISHPDVLALNDHFFEARIPHKCIS